MSFKTGVKQVFRGIKRTVEKIQENQEEKKRLEPLKLQKQILKEQQNLEIVRQRAKLSDIKAEKQRLNSKIKNNNVPTLNHMSKHLRRSRTMIRERPVYQKKKVEKKPFDDNYIEKILLGD